MTKLTKYGRREWLSTVIFTAALVAVVAVTAWRVHWLLLLCAVLPLAICVWVLAFFRDPQRDTPAGPGLFISPADGVVADITPVGPESPLGASGVRIGVFMSVFNVHVNRSPCDGRIEDVKHSKGAFLDVRKPEAWERNESATIEMSVEHGGRRHRVLVRQISGLVARRIVTDLAVGQEVQRGQRIGMIKFGSRLELWLGDELGAAPAVRVGQKVSAGLTVLARMESDNG